MTKTTLLLSSVLLAFSLPVLAEEKKAPAKPDVVVPAGYPLTTCVVSDDKLGEMGKPIEYIHQEAGKPDRVMLLCCEHCIQDVKLDPAKYVKKLDDAAKGGAPAKAKDAPADHKHH